MSSPRLVVLKDYRFSDIVMSRGFFGTTYESPGEIQELGAYVSGESGGELCRIVFGPTNFNGKIEQDGHSIVARVEDMNAFFHDALGIISGADLTGTRLTGVYSVVGDSYKLITLGAPNGGDPVYKNLGLRVDAGELFD